MEESSYIERMMVAHLVTNLLAFLGLEVSLLCSQEPIAVVPSSELDEFSLHFRTSVSSRSILIFSHLGVGLQNSGSRYI
jgi:hypothetical protein